MLRNSTGEALNVLTSRQSSAAVLLFNGTFPFLLKPRAGKCGAGRPQTISVRIKNFCFSRSRVGSGGFVYHNVAPYDHPADVVSGRVKSEHLEGQLIVILLNVAPDAHVRGQ